MIRRRLGTVDRELERELGQLQWLKKATAAAGKGVKVAAKAVGKGAAKVGTTAAKVTTTAAATAARGVAAAGKGVGKGAAAAGKGAVSVSKKFSPPWEGVGTDKGWATRLAQRLVNVGFTPDAIICNTKKYRNSAFCRARGAIGWEAAKKGIETAFAIPPGTLDRIEGELNKVGTDPVKRETRARQIATEKKIPIEALMPVVIKTEDPPWWRQFLEAVGLG